MTTATQLHDQDAERANTLRALVKSFIDKVGLLAREGAEMLEQLDVQHAEIDADRRTTGSRTLDTGTSALRSYVERLDELGGEGADVVAGMDERLADFDAGARRTEPTEQEKRREA